VESGGGVGMIGLPKAREIEKKIRIIPMKECMLAPGLCIESMVLMLRISPFKR
jgi:hypothetical protein